MKKCLVFFLLFLAGTSWSQINLDPDTVLYEQRTGGILDTFDISTGDLPTTFDGGQSVLSESGFSTWRLFQDLTTRRFQRFTKYEPLKFSAIPHLGFAYSFGGQGTQYLRLDYSQAFNDSLLLNFKYDRNTRTGYLRNSGFTGDNVRLQLQRRGQVYSMKLCGSFQSYTVSHPGGIDTVPGPGEYSADTIIEFFGLEFVPVLKENASSSTKLGNARLFNYLNFLKDSSNHMGLVTRHDYSIVNRVFIESSSLNSLADIYGITNIDSMNTDDRLNYAEIRNAAGFYYSNRNNGFYIDGKLQHSYWAIMDLKQRTDTTEIGLLSDLRFNFGGFTLKNHLNFNFVGAFNEWNDQASIVYSKGKVAAFGGLKVGNIAPDPLQRVYFGNYYDYKLTAISNQFMMRTTGGVKWNVIDSVLNLSGKVDYTYLSSVYTFDGMSWAPDAFSDFSMVSATLKGHLQLGVFNWYPTVVYSTAQDKYLPNMQLYSRFLVKGRLFKAKKMQAAVGIDVSYISSFSYRTYVPAMDVFYWYGGSDGTTDAMSNLHAFASFGIDEFRFFVRYENIGYFWNDKTLLEVNGYPMASPRLRIGLTWDFFN